MGHDHGATRREFLRWMGVAPGAVAALAGGMAVAGGAVGGCGDEGPSGAGPGDVGANPDATTGADGDTGLLDLASDGADPDLVEDGVRVCQPTAADVRGPFFLEGAPQRAVLAGPEEPGERLSISGVVLGPDCETPLPGALLDVWQADAEGAYHGDTETYRLRGQVLTDAEGAFAFETIRPGHYREGAGLRPAHIHFTVTAPGHRPLTTQLYFAGDPWLAPADPCTICNSEDETLIIPLEEDASGAVAAWRGRFDIVLRRV
jgi:catechol 1,2-dioxygenase